MSRAHRLSLVCALALAALAAPLSARRVLAQEAAASGAPSRQDLSGQTRRQQLEQQLRQDFWRISKQRISLSDEQIQRLEETSRRLDVRRRALFQEERAQRKILRAEILADARADQARVATALDRLLQLQRQRVELQRKSSASSRPS